MGCSGLNVQASSLRSSPYSHPASMKILVRAPNWIGDAVMATPALAALRRRFPSADIALLARPTIAALFEAHPDIDRCILYERPGRHDGLGGLMTLVGALRRDRFDLAVLFQNAFEAAVISVAAGIPNRIGYARDGRRFLLTASCPSASAPRHLRAAYLHLMTLCGADDGHPPSDLPCLVVRPREREAAAEMAGWAQTDIGVGINPGAAYGSAKRWAPERFAAVADGLVRRFGVRVVILGSAAEREIAEAVQRAMTTPSVVLAGQTTVRQMMGLLARCRLLVTNDSGPMHVAAALGTPVVAVFGPTDPTATSPAGAPCTLVQQPVDCAPCTHRACPRLSEIHRCMTGVPVSAVLAAAEVAIAQSDAHRW